MENSQLYSMGMWDAAPALDIFADGAVIKDNIIRGGYAGILLNGSSGHQIIGNEISHGSAGIILEELKKGDTIIQGNKISNMIFSGIFMESNPYFTGENNTFENIWGEDVGGWGANQFSYHIILLAALPAIITLLILFFLIRKKRKAA